MTQVWYLCTRHSPGTPPHPSALGHTFAHVRRSRPPESLPDVVPPPLWHLGIERDRAMRGDRGQVRPCPGHHVDELVSATAKCDPLATADLVRQLVNGLVRRTHGVHGQRQVSQRVEDV